MALRRLKKEWTNIQNDPLETGSAAPVSDEDMYHWTGTIVGPSNTPYCDGIFHVDIRLPDTYPLHTPQFTFTTPIFHPNVSSQGDIQLGDVDRKQWCPAVTIRLILISLQAHLSDPNLGKGCVLNEEAASMYLEDLEGFERKAREFTVAHAMSGETT